MGKQVLEKCLSTKLQSETTNVDFTTIYSRSILTQIAASLRR